MKSATVACLAVLVFGSGCASMMGSKEQAVSVETILNGDRLEDARCSLNNSEGTWFVKTPGSTTIHKSTSDLNVKCEKPPHPTGLLVVQSSVNGSMFGNILVGGIIGVVVDASTGAGFDYPTLIRVSMGETATPDTMGKAPLAESPQIKNVVVKTPEQNSPPVDTGREKNCYVKGVVRFGEKYYYTPGDRKYYDTQLDPGRGDKWFCSEEEAMGAGFRSIIK